MLSPPHHLLLVGTALFFFPPIFHREPFPSFSGCPEGKDFFPDPMSPTCFSASPSFFSSGFFLPRSFQAAPFSRDNKPLFFFHEKERPSLSGVFFTAPPPSQQWGFFPP